MIPHFAFRTHELIQHTPRKTKQPDKSIIHHPKRRHIKRPCQMLRHKLLSEVIATGTYFSIQKFIEGYYCSQVVFGMTSKILQVPRMKTQSGNMASHQHTDVIMPNRKLVKVSKNTLLFSY
jgi:hypothetical protein